VISNLKQRLSTYTEDEIMQQSLALNGATSDDIDNFDENDLEDKPKIFKIEPS